MDMIHSFAFYNVDLHAVDLTGLVFGIGYLRATARNGKTHANR